NDVGGQAGRFHGADRIRHRVRVHIDNAQVPNSRADRHRLGSLRDNNGIDAVTWVLTDVIETPRVERRQRVGHWQCPTHHQIHVSILWRQLEGNRGSVGRDDKLVIIQGVGSRDRVVVPYTVG